MSSRASWRDRAQGLAFRFALAIALASVTIIGVIALSAGTFPTRAVTPEVDRSVGPVCFFRNGYPHCVGRSGPDVSAAPTAVSLEALLTALLDGPTVAERLQGIESALPPGTELDSVQTDGLSITVRLDFPTGYLDADVDAPITENTQYAMRDWENLFGPLASEAIVDQFVRTLFPLGYRHFHVEAQDPTVPGTFRPLSAYLPPTIIPPKEEPTRGNDFTLPTAQGVDATVTATGHGQPPVEVLAQPQGALSGKTVYISSGHGWNWNSINWRTQRPPYPDSTTGYYGPIIEDHNNAEVVNQYLLRYLRNAGADVWTARERDMNTFGQVVDDDTTGFDALGAWEVVEGDGYSGGHLKATTDLIPSAVVTWTLGPVLADGFYALYVWYVPGSDRIPDAHYTVYHASGSTELLVDQRHHGSTWRYVGRFPVRAGELLTVSLSNRSAILGPVVVADAVRLGGGWFDNSDLATYGGPVETEAPYAPNKPWWEVAAYYHVQRLGVDPDDFSYYNDVVARPFWARWEHANTGDDAIYVSWHTNGYNGHNTSVWGTVSYIHSSQPVAGSSALRHAIHSELIKDIRAGWDSDWRDLGEASRDLGELRELWDSDPNNAIPGVLLEIAYHDNVNDTDALKDPRFALLSARAVYQGIVKYFGENLTLLPEPPTHLRVRNDGPGQITVSWRPSPTDSVGLVGNAAESYRLYTSRDGFGWDNGRAVVDTQTVLTGMLDNELIFVRVTAINAGGESFPTPVLAARSSPSGVAPVLLVDGFDRIDRHGLILEDDPTEGINARLFPDQINRFDYLIQHGESITLPFDSAVNEAVAGGDLDLAAYRIVDWVLGEESTVDHTFDPAEQAAVAAYLEAGGALFVSGAEIGWDLVTKGNGPSFFQTYLGADMAGDDAGTYLTTPTDEGIFAGLGPVWFRESYDVDYPDQLLPRAGSIAALNYLGGAEGVAAIQYDAGSCRRVVYFGFPFETIDAISRPEVMARVLGYLGADGCLNVSPQTAITTPISGAAFNTVPDFGGIASGVNPIARVEVQIVDSRGRYWAGTSWVTTSQWLTGIGTTSWQYPLPSPVLTTTPSGAGLDQGGHYLWARAWDTANVSDSTPAYATFMFDTIPPTTPTLVAPVDGITLTAPPMKFLWRGPLSDTGSALGYNLSLDSHILTSPVTYYLPLRGFTAGVHTWRVRVFDAAGNRSPWTEPWTFVMDTYDLFLPMVYGNDQDGTAVPNQPAPGVSGQ